jgi:hypothetical protein
LLRHEQSCGVFFGVGNDQGELAEMFVNFLVDEIVFGGRKYLFVEEMFSLWNDPAVEFF